MFSITYIVEAKEGNLAWHIWSLIARSNRHLPNWNDPVIITQTPFTHSAPSTQIQTVPIFVHSYRHWNTHQKSFAARSLSKIIVSETITKSHSLLDPCPKLSSLKHPPSHLLLDPCPKLSSLKHPPTHSLLDPWGRSPNGAPLPWAPLSWLACACLPW